MGHGRRRQLNSRIEQTRSVTASFSGCSEKSNVDATKADGKPNRTVPSGGGAWIATPAT
jgi:hypothetical protein